MTILQQDVCTSVLLGILLIIVLGIVWLSVLLALLHRLWTGLARNTVPLGTMRIILLNIVFLCATKLPISGVITPHGDVCLLAPKVLTTILTITLGNVPKVVLEGCLLIRLLRCACLRLIVRMCLLGSLFLAGVSRLVQSRCLLSSIRLWINACLCVLRVSLLIIQQCTVFLSVLSTLISTHTTIQHSVDFVCFSALYRRLLTTDTTLPDNVWQLVLGQITSGMW